MKRTAVLCACLLSTPAWASPATFDLIYDPDTGSLTMDTFGGRVLNYVIEGGLFIFENHNSPLGSDSPFTTSLEIEISDTHLTAPFLPEPWNLGNILQPGLTEQQFVGSITRTGYVEDFGAGLHQFDLIYGESDVLGPPVDATEPDVLDPPVDATEPDILDPPVDVTEPDVLGPLVDATEYDFQSFPVFPYGNVYLSNPDQLPNLHTFAFDTMPIDPIQFGDRSLMMDFFTVPEPNSLGLLAAAGLLVFRRRRSASRSS